MARKSKNTTTVTTPVTANQYANFLKNAKIVEVKPGKLIVKYKTGRMKKSRQLAFYIAPTWMEEEIEVEPGLPAKKAAPKTAAKDKKAAPKTKAAPKDKAKSKSKKAAPKTKAAPKADERTVETAKAVFGLFDKDSVFKLKEIIDAAGMPASRVRKAVAVLVGNQKLAVHGKASATRYTLPGVELPAKSEKAPAKTKTKKPAEKTKTAQTKAKKPAEKTKTAKTETPQDPRTTGTALPDPDADEKKTAPKRPGKPGANGTKAKTKKAAAPKDPPPAPAPTADTGSGGEENDWSNIDWNV